MMRQSGRASDDGKMSEPDGSDDTLLLRSEVARILGVAPTTVTRWAREGRLACRVTLGGHHRFERSLVEKIREQMEHGGVPRAPGQRNR